MLEKGKGNVLGKLRTIQLVEGDLKLVMRVLVTLRNSKRAEKSNRLSIYNFGNRKNFDIQTALLEKQLIKDSATVNNLPILHYLDDRQACYDRQLPDIGLLTERSFGMNVNEAVMLCDALKKFRHFISTGHGIACQSYGGQNDLLGGTGQGNILSGSICKNVSCLIFRFLEKIYRDSLRYLL